MNNDTILLKIPYLYKANVILRRCRKASFVDVYNEMFVEIPTFNGHFEEAFKMAIVEDNLVNSHQRKVMDSHVIYNIEQKPYTSVVSNRYQYFVDNLSDEEIYKRAVNGLTLEEWENHISHIRNDDMYYMFSMKDHFPFLDNGHKGASTKFAEDDFEELVKTYISNDKEAVEKRIKQQIQDSELRLVNGNFMVKPGDLSVCYQNTFMIDSPTGYNVNILRGVEPRSIYLVTTFGGMPGYLAAGGYIEKLSEFLERKDFVLKNEIFFKENDLSVFEDNMEADMCKGLWGRIDYLIEYLERYYPNKSQSKKFLMEAKHLKAENPYSFDTINLLMNNLLSIDKIAETRTFYEDISMIYDAGLYAMNNLKENKNITRLKQ